ncbi:hypothetical protein IRZ71_11935 [Flavobacterium sp. ANB]|uniref:hypothetical protein n=1 Tax=unclassified Flavobacterium TaxID=196869 RepID=UPI0012B91F07|nr:MULTISPECIES: hypothetical protein [unclassified Flavobacterium]MBF4517063.1 hypothetical protein [Flavobacterium sp. ANB]MTD71800.1 hypothetical protein [Flavobacterium sp. LC2016-13]
MFFDFDSVEYYSLNKSKEEEMDKNHAKGIDNTIVDKIFYNEYPEKVNNTFFYETINSDGFSKFELSQKDIQYLRNDIFLEKSSLKKLENVYACSPQYRDILVFKKNKEISGVAKICLSCRQFYLISSKKEIQTENFGTEEEYKSLEKLFNKYKKG